MEKITILKIYIRPYSKMNWISVLNIKLKQSNFWKKNRKISSQPGCRQIFLEQKKKNKNKYKNDILNFIKIKKPVPENHN